MAQAGGDRLLRSEARFRAAVEAVSGVLWTNNAAGEMEGEQPGWASLTGQSIVEYQGYGWSKAVHPEDAQPTIDAWNMAVAARAPFVFEHRVRRHDGVWRRFTIRAVPVLEADGTIREWVGVHTDVTEQRQAELDVIDTQAQLERLVQARTAELQLSEARLAESEAHFRLLAEHGRDMVSRVSADGSRAYVSPASARIFGVAPDVLVRQRVPFRIHADDCAAVVLLQQRLLRGEVDDEMLEFRVLNPERGEVWVEASARSLRDRVTGDPDGYVTVIREITARKDLENALRHGQRMEAIGKIAAGVAHDFNNILQAVMGGLEVLFDSLKEGTQDHEMARLAYNSARRGSYLTHHLLSYSGKQVLQPVAVDLRLFLGETQALLSRSLGPNIQVQVLTSPAVTSARVDPSQLQTALLNLAVNAQHALPQGGTLRLEACESGEDGFVALSVIDDGTGMDHHTLAHATEPFFTTKGAQGTGLGLSMVQGFVTQSGGRLRITSVPGQGTAVRLLLPAAPAPAARTEAREPPERDVAPRHARGRVLLVDDEPDILVIVTAFLEGGGYSVVIARSGEEALALLANDRRFDALITDFAMPGLSGAALIVEVRGFLPGLPTLMITGFAQTAVTGMTLEHGAIVQKPFSRHDLMIALRALTEAGSARGAAAVMP